MASALHILSCLQGEKHIFYQLDWSKRTRSLVFMFTRFNTTIMSVFEEHWNIWFTQRNQIAPNTLEIKNWWLIKKFHLGPLKILLIKPVNVLKNVRKFRNVASCTRISFFITTRIWFKIDFVFKVVSINNCVNWAKKLR